MYIWITLFTAHFFSFWCHWKYFNVATKPPARPKILLEERMVVQNCSSVWTNKYFRKSLRMEAVGLGVTSKPIKKWILFVCFAFDFSNRQSFPSIHCMLFDLKSTFTRRKIKEEEEITFQRDSRTDFVFHLKGSANSEAGSFFRAPD